ncbi:MarR family transcriptional regulator [Nocardia sp. JMUB6875]|uniref:MarR family winged helix-turn-helix transcriptional regulator n=1 Tax=Nocardia sp. JMUB6875 TaxID=3158170 RepID=UPI0032E5CAED
MSSYVLPQRLLAALKSADTRIRVAKNAALDAAGLTHPQFTALRVLSVDPGLTAAEIARRCEVTPQTMAALLPRMEAAGLAERHRNPRTGAVEVVPTADGRAKYAEALAQLDLVEASVAAALSAAEADQLCDLLERCAQAAKAGRST